MPMRNANNFDDDLYTYGRPSFSSWIAVVAVAFAFFIIGGFIKTYLQLETLREETQREMKELRGMLERLRVDEGQLAARTSGARLPKAERRSDSARGRAAVSPSASRERFSVSEEERRGVRVDFGRKSGTNPPELQERLDNLQVIAIGDKRVMVEGGADVGFAAGTRLELTRAKKYIADLRVLEVSPTMAACEVLHANVPPQPGDSVRLPESPARP